MKSLVLMVAMVAVCLSIGFCYAQEERPTPTTRCMEGHYDPSWPIVQVVSGRPGQLVVGTGVPIGGTGEHRLFFTAAHVADVRAPLAIMGNRGQLNTPARIVAMDEERDIAILTAQIPMTNPMRDWPLAPECPPGGNGAWGGYGPSQNQYRQMLAPIARYGCSWLRSEGRIVKGMSGGPVFTPNGIIGIITANTEREALAVRVEWLRGFLAASLPHDRHADIAGGPVAVASDWTTLNARTGIKTLTWKPVAWTQPIYVGILGDNPPNFSQ